MCNIDGNVTMTQGRGLSAEIVAHKIGRKGNGDLVKAVLDETADGDRVGTVYLDDARDNSGCNRRNNDHNNSRNGWHEPLDVDMPFDNPAAGGRCPDDQYRRRQDPPPQQ